MKLLIIYYSWSNGNTERIAKMLQKATGADMVKLETETPYQGTYEEVVEQGKRETEQGYRPVIKPVDVSVADYDVIAVGTPTWWYTMAPAVLTFLSEQNWHGKKVVPFMTNGGWPGHVIKDMKQACAGAEFACEIQIKYDSQGGDRLETPETDIEKWINEVKALVGN